MKQTKEVLTKLKNQSKDFKKQKKWMTNFVNSNKRFLETSNISLSYDYNLVINVKSRKELHKVRQELKRTLKWNDKVKQVWDSIEALASYNSEKYPYIQIWIHMESRDKLEEFLNQNKEKKCKFIETKQTSYDYVCDVS